MKVYFLLALLSLFSISNGQMKTVGNIEDYDVTWETPSKDAAGSMPIGNGEVMLNVWVEDTTGDILFYIARSDTLSEISRILKLGRVRVHLDPNPFLNSIDFRQHLRLQDGVITIWGNGEHLDLFVDSAANTIHLLGDLKTPRQITATVEDWRIAPRKIPKEEQGSAWSVHDAPFDLIESADVFEGDAEAVRWFHRNESSVVPQVLANQSLTGAKGAFDPLIHRTFGASMRGAGVRKVGPRALEGDNVEHVDLAISTNCAQTKDVAQWRQGVQAEMRKSPTQEALTRTEAWWRNYWNQAWVITQDPAISRGYLLQRYVQACQGRGAYPIKFNGGYYTVEPTAMGKKFDADWRAWGDSHWYQNVRHMYAPMPESGDLQMMEPFFRLYESARPLAESRSRIYHGAQGVYFPETMTIWGTYSSGDYGWDRTGHQPSDVLCPWWQYAWNQGPELVGLMLDRWDYSRNEKFLKDRALPMAISVLTYFDTRFKKDDHGRIVLDPTQVVETYWEGVKNDMPSTAGLIAITRRLSALPRSTTTAAQRSFFERMKAACPELPMRMVDGKPALAPAQEYVDKTSNVENGELYAVWPFRLVNLANPKLLEAAKQAYAVRKNHLDVGWGYDGNVAALLGMTDEAARILKVKCANSHPAYRWPATWGPNFDWLPDQNHGGNLLNTTQLMLLQGESLEDGGAIRLLPAWPRDWDVDFKLHAPGNTTVHCVLKSGKITTLVVTPAARRKDVILPAGVEEQLGANR